jgi:hypothetical protein
MMPARRPRGSDAAGRPSPRTSPALGTSPCSVAGIFLATISVLLASADFASAQSPLELPFASYGTVSYPSIPLGGYWCGWRTAYVPELNAILMAGGVQCSGLSPFSPGSATGTTRSVYLWKDQPEPVPGDYTSTQHGDMTNARWCHAMVAYGRKVYAIGGATTGGQNVIGGMGMTTSVEVFNFDTNMWSDGPSLPEARASLGCAVSITAAEHVVVCAGGYVHAFKSDVWKLDLTDSSASWVSLPNMLATSEDPLVLASNGYIYAIGGYRNHGSMSNTVQVMDTSSSSPSWTYTLALPEVRRGALGVASTGDSPNLYIFAGSDGAGNMVNKLLYTEVEDGGATGTVFQWIANGGLGGGLTGVDYAISGVYRWVYPQLFYSDDTGVVFINPKTATSFELVSIWQATCSDSQYRVGDYCKDCPPSTGVSSSHPSATSTGGSATSCTCPENYYAYAGMYAPSTYDWACAECPVGYSFIKNGSVIPTADGVSDTCDCPAGYYLDNTGLNCNECPPGQTSAGGRVTECYSAPASSCTTSQYLKDGACVACPSSTSGGCAAPPCPPTPPSSTSTGGDATYCTCPENYVASYIISPDSSPSEWKCTGCGDSWQKNGSAIPTESGNSDSCDCKAGYYLSGDGLSCHECPAGQTTAGGRMTECTSDGSRASGGTVTIVGDYVIHTFISDGTFANADSTLTEIDVLVVGGGGGGSTAGGGGGGGAVVSNTVSIVEASYSVMVGEGGDSDLPGGTSAFASLAIASGGSWDTNEIGPGGRSGAGSPLGENPGAHGVTCENGPGGGGGGAGASAMASSDGNTGGHGGDGIQSSINGTATWYGGGGGGAGEYSGTPGEGGNGGLGGGGKGYTSPAPPEKGSPNTGGGGGGGCAAEARAGSDGGSGIVIVRYKKKSASTPSSSSCSSSRATGGTVTTVGEYTIHNFTSIGTFTVTDSTLTEVEVLIVGGGGGGRHSHGGGGGGGAVLYSASKTLTSSSITVTVGNGGHGGVPAGTNPGEGGASAFDSMVANGGKVGNGDPNPGGASGSGNAGGGGHYGCCSIEGGGGGGAGGPGEAAQAYDAGDGGPGAQSAISGSSKYYGGGGGGGGSSSSNSGNGGLGGGASGSISTDASPGSAFTGGGGGGGGHVGYGGSGGSGIVIVRYKSATCNDQSCGANYYHDGSDCVACPTGSTRMPETANQCLCPENHHRSVDGGVYSCAACAQGSTRLPGDTVPGGDATTCTSSVSPPPPPPSAQALEKVAEETRDSILADIADARLKAKAKLLADAAIAGAKVQRLTAKMSAADEDTACSNAFSGAGMSSGDGACVATAASSGKRRRLSSTTYDVELMFSSATVSDDALTTAADALKTADGVTSVASQASVDPITELKTVPGVDTSKLQTFDTQAQAAVAAASTPPPSIPPPTPPPPPKPNLVLDDDDAAVGLRGWFVACVAAMLVLVLVV